MKREPIALALFALLKNLSSVKSVDRVMRSVNGMQPSECPALFLISHTQTAVRSTGLPTKWTLDYVVYIYTRRGSADESPETQINAVLDDIEAALQPAGGTENQRLGGLVDWCRIDGNIETDAGALGDAALAVVPIRIQVSTS